ncbi:MAG TPA: hypothetical protein VN081_01190 [Dongiaceae bacterium]|nr:hypothetical protein [Dongiaceae bacterium]
MRQINARNLAALPKNELWAIPDQPLAVEFDDGILETNVRATIFSAYIWDFYNKYPGVRTRKSHHLNMVGLGKQHMLGKETHLVMLGMMMKDIYDDYKKVVDLEEMWRHAYIVTNNIYNDFTYRCEAYVTTISALDLVEVLAHPEIQKINAEVQPTHESVDASHDKIKKILETNPDLIRNPLAVASRTGHSSTGQIVQMVGPRGYITDIDSNIFRYPVLRGYAMGIRSLHDAMIESRFASKSLFFTKDPLQQTEYFNRKLQLMTNTLENLHRVDCGSTSYMPVRLQGRDLTGFEGQYYWDGAGLKVLQRTDRHLVGEVVQFRSVLHCQHPDPRGVCEICFGTITQSVPLRTNLGHMSSTTLCEKISQKVLSTKHEDGSSNVLDIELSEYERRYIRAVPNEHVLKLSERLAGKNVTMTIYAPEAAHLSDIKTIENLSTVTLNRISELSSVMFTVERKEGVEQPAEVVVSMDRRKSSMSHHFLEHIKKVGWGLTPQGNFTIDLKDWDASLPMFELPLRHVNMLDFMKRIEAVIRSTGDSGKRIVRGQKTFKDFTNTKDALMELYTLVTDKIKVNVTHLAVIVKASQIRSSENLDFRIPLFGNKTEFGTYTDKMQYNSLGPQMAYQNHQRVISSVRSYIIRDRNDHPLDSLISAVDESQPEP